MEEVDINVRCALRQQVGQVLTAVLVAPPFAYVTVNWSVPFSYANRVMSKRIRRGSAFSGRNTVRRDVQVREFKGLPVCDPQAIGSAIYTAEKST